MDLDTPTSSRPEEGGAQTTLTVIWDMDIRPRLIPKAAIEADAKAMLARWGERAAEMAFIEEDRAWRYSDSLQQGRWHRVRAAIERMTDEGV